MHSAFSIELVFYFFFHISYILQIPGGFRDLPLNAFPVGSRFDEHGEQLIFSDSFKVEVLLPAGNNDEIHTFKRKLDGRFLCRSEN